MISERCPASGKGEGRNRRFRQGWEKRARRIVKLLTAKVIRATIPADIRLYVAIRQFARLAPRKWNFSATRKRARKTIHFIVCSNHTADFLVSYVVMMNGD